MVLFIATLGIQWKFTPKRAPWYGGLIGLTKMTLRKVLGRHLLPSPLIVKIEVVLQAVSCSLLIPIDFSSVLARFSVIAKMSVFRSGRFTNCSQAKAFLLSSHPITHNYHGN